MNCQLAIQCLPKVANHKDLVRIVDEVISYIDSTGLSYLVGPFETTVEGDLDDLMDVIKFSQIKAIKAGASSVSTYIKLVYSEKDHILTSDEKISKYNK
ncbi:MAG: thiamine-binding protein [Anaerococcus sp.]|nr:thiamine-binding protein [Anaerococcus sp.]